MEAEEEKTFTRSPEKFGEFEYVVETAISRDMTETEKKILMFLWNPTMKDIYDFDELIERWKEEMDEKTKEHEELMEKFREEVED